MIEEFFVIGADTEQIDVKELERNNGELFVDSKYLYMFRSKSDQTNDPIKQSVRQFCFPNGVRVRVCTTNKISKILYHHSDGNEDMNNNGNNKKNNSFIFTIKQGEDGNSY